MEATPVPLAARAAHLRSSAIRDLLALTQRPGVISLAGGLPAPDAFPVERIAAVTARLLRSAPEALLQYSTTEGHPGLRAWIAERATTQRARPVGADDVLVTHGSQQALDLLAKVLVDPGATVAIDEPGYVGAIQALSLFEPDFLPVPVDRDGMRVDVLAERLEAGARPRLLYTVVNFQNPTGATMSQARRARLAQLAEHYGFLVVEDDPYGALRFAGEPVASVARWSDLVVSLGTFSKLVAPGLRIGWMVVPAWLRPVLVRAKQGADLHTSSWGQAVLAEVVAERAWLADHTEALVRLYGTRMRALADALTGELGEGVGFERPDGGMFLWARIPGVDTTALLAAAVERGVAFVPGAAFFAGPGDPGALRLSYSVATPETLHEGARRLARALADRGTSPP